MSMGSASFAISLSLVLMDSAVREIRIVLSPLEVKSLLPLHQNHFLAKMFYQNVIFGLAVFKH